jgi:uncharacterized protein (TIGR02231 family)
MSKNHSVSTFNAREIPITTVTVFTDRAEISRNLGASLKPGFNEVRLENVAGSIEATSIRVDGEGDGIIHGVKYESIPVNFDEIDLPKVKELRTQLKEMENEAQKDRDLLSILNARIEALNNAVKTIGQNTTKSDTLVTFNETAEASMENFFDYHERKCIQLKAQIREVEKNLQKKDLEIQRLNDELNQYRWNMTSKNTISIELENPTSGEIAVGLNVIYHVYGARWSPSYDIRVKSQSKEHSMNLTYFGNIQQQTGEDWTNIDLLLSTAQPGLGGDLPVLGTTVVQFKPPPPPPQQPQRYQMREEMCMDRAEIQCARVAAPMMKMGRTVASAEERMLSTNFTIPSKKTIPSDTSEHKVTIAVETLKAYLHYHCVPKKDTNVFLMATVINETDYPILAGPASVYINNSMSAMINLKPTSCGEKLECPLGVDKTVKVIYKPTHKFKSSVGLINKSAASGNEQRIVVKNNKRSEAILITLHEPVPKSADEKIKVTLTSPSIAKPTNETTKAGEDTRIVHMPSVGAELDDLNNLLWTETIAPEHEKDFIVKWSIDYPTTEQLEFVENFEQN